jgi:TRAP-type mannitol/chloroaromatic compound transport system permease small subunit
MRELARKIDAFQERFGQGVSWLMLAMVVVVFTDVVFRYLFNRSSVFVQEAEWHLFGLVYLLAAGYTMLYDEHVRIDIFYSRWSPRRKAAMDFAMLFVMYLPSAAMIIAATVPFVKHSLAVNEGSPDPGGIPYRWAYKSVIIVGFLILTLQAVSQAIKNFYWMMGWEERERRVQEIH